MNVCKFQYLSVIVSVASSGWPIVVSMVVFVHSSTAPVDAGEDLVLQNLIGGVFRQVQLKEACVSTNQASVLLYLLFAFNAGRYGEGAGGGTFKGFERLGNAVRAPAELDEGFPHFLSLTAQPLPEVNNRRMVGSILVPTGGSITNISSYFLEQVNIDIRSATDPGLQFTVSDSVS